MVFPASNEHDFPLMMICIHVTVSIRIQPPGKCIVFGCYETVSRSVPGYGDNNIGLILDTLRLAGIHHAFKAAFTALGGSIGKLLDLLARLLVYLAAHGSQQALFGI